MKKSIVYVWIVALLFLCACAKQDIPVGSSCYTLYFVSNDHTKLISQEYWTTTTDETELFNELYKKLSEVPEKLEYTPPFSNDVILKSWNLQNGRLLLDFQKEYAKLSAENEVLIRAAIVKTFTQIGAVNYVTFQVEGEDLEDCMGKLVGAMYMDSFIYNEGAQINSYEEVTLNLYFSNKEGDALVKMEKTIMYNTNVAKEKVILEQIIQGPKGNKGYATVNPDTKIISVVVKDNVCYVNLSETFLTQVYSVSPEVAMYSIVNSLCELSNVDKVQILIEGDSGTTFRETFPLNITYEANRKIMESVLTN